ncbi:MAG: hypoxanthine phosphoribosyltransferase [Clostridia bacterium]|nr:hypoxanthine phosphoribosyltransferase [Clostridia bacterium]
MIDKLKKLPVLIEEEKIQKRIMEIAQQIDRDYNGEDIVVISILKGAIFFTVDLVKKMKTPIQLEVMQISSYSGTESTGELIIKKDLDHDIEGKNVLVVEDIIDTGKTLSYLKDYLSSKNPKSLKIAVLADKFERRKVEVKLDYKCFEIPDKFVVGYGFDVDEQGRNIPYIGYLEE